MERSNYVYLPAEIIREILLRLPVKALLRFKCVCKDWCSIIGNESFTQEHFGHESNQERLLVPHFISDEERYVFALFADDLCSAYKVPDHLQIPDAIAALMGPVNGVFFVVNFSGSMALLNPATKQFKPLPSFHQNVQPHGSWDSNVHGFGLDVLSGDFKIVSQQYCRNEEYHFTSLIFVYSSDDYDDNNEEDSLDDSILAFDMTSEKFREIKVPGYCTKSKECYLTVYSDTIALLSYVYDKIGICIEIWVMEKEGCWIKISTLVPFVDFDWPLGFWKKNELVLETGPSSLTLYNISTKKSRIVQVQRKMYGYILFWVFCYKESLVSLEGEGDVASRGILLLIISKISSNNHLAGING